MVSVASPEAAGLRVRKIHPSKLLGDAYCPKIRAMEIYELIWPEERIEHIARHGVRPEAVEEVGQTDAGRYLFCVIIQFPDGNGFPVTARPMTQKEQRRFNQWKHR